MKKESSKLTKDEKNKINAAKQKCKDIIKKKEAKIEELQSRIKSTKDELARIEAIKKQQEKEKQLKESLSCFVDSDSDSNSDSDNLEYSLYTKEEVKNIKESFNKIHTTEINKYKLEIEILQNKLNQSNALLNKRLVTIQKHENNIEQLSKNNEYLKNNNRDLEYKLNQQNQSENVLTEPYKITIATLENKIIDLHNKINKLINQNQESKVLLENLPKLQSELACSSEMIKTTKQELKNQKKKIDKANIQSIETQEIIKAKNIEIQKLKTEIMQKAKDQAYKDVISETYIKNLKKSSNNIKIDITKKALSKIDMMEQALFQNINEQFTPYFETVRAELREKYPEEAKNIEKQYSDRMQSFKANILAAKLEIKSLINLDLEQEQESKMTLDLEQKQIEAAGDNADLE